MKTPDYTLYVATDRKCLKGRDLLTVLDETLAGGATIIQLREKDISGREYFDIAREVRSLTSKYNVPLIINDRVDIMQAVEADGVHLGEHDIPLPEVRRIAPEKIIGYTVHNFDELRHAQDKGADYIGVGPVFKTATKTVAAPTLGTAGLQELVQQSSIPCVAISGINSKNAFEAAACGVAGCCIISDILRADDPKNKTRQLKELIQKGHKLMKQDIPACEQVK